MKLFKAWKSIDRGSSSRKLIGFLYDFSFNCCRKFVNKREWSLSSWNCLWNILVWQKTGRFRLISFWTTNWWANKMSHLTHSSSSYLYSHHFHLCRRLNLVSFFELTESHHNNKFHSKMRQFLFFTHISLWMKRRNSQKWKLEKVVVLPTHARLTTAMLN
jgi:hypothetical protein